MPTLTVNVKTQHLPALKQAARELGIDLINDAPEGEWVSIHVIIQDNYQLILLGHIAGVNSTCNSLKGPMGEMMSDIERSIDKIKKKKDNQNEGS